MLRTTDEYSGHLEGIPRQEFSYGGSERQFCQLFVEFESDRPLPVLVFIHGGCWMNEYPARMTSKLCATFSRKLGIAVWNIEYSMLGDDTGGYPGTFTDVSKAIGLLQNVTSFSLDLSHIVLAGHSAGGQLAAWYVASNAGNSLPIKSVISLAGVHDLARAIELDICGKSIKHLVNNNSNLMSLLSPSTYTWPASVPLTFVSGILDQWVPHAYIIECSRVIESSICISIPGAGHFEIVYEDWEHFDTLILPIFSSQFSSLE